MVHAAEWYLFIVCRLTLLWEMAPNPVYNIPVPSPWLGQVWLHAPATKGGFCPWPANENKLHTHTRSRLV